MVGPASEKAIPPHYSLEALKTGTKISYGLFLESVIQLTKEVRFWKNLRFSWRLSQPRGQID